MVSGHVGTCAKCGKRSYSSRTDARSANHADGLAGERLNAYRCGNYWHLGHLPNEVRRGRVPRSSIAGVALEKRLAAALRAFHRNPADGLAWLRAIAAREALARSIERHPAGKAAVR